MVPLTSLLLPIVLAAVLVFLVSSVIHMVLPYHRSVSPQYPRRIAPWPPCVRSPSLLGSTSCPMRAPPPR